MATAVRSCPKCSAPMGSVPLDVEVRCGKCGMTMTFRARPAPPPAPPPAAAAPVLPAAAAAPVGPAAGAGGWGLSPGAKMALAAGGTVLLLGAGMLGFLVAGRGGRPPEGASPTPAATEVAAAPGAAGGKPVDRPADKPADKPVDKPADKPSDKPADKPAEKPGGGPGDKPAPPADKPVAPPVPAGVVALAPEMQRQVDEAIRKGKDFLQRQGLEDDAANIPHSLKYAVRELGGRSGPLTLKGLTLLECGVPADDPGMRAIADTVREAVPQLNSTYGLALAILFLDRLKQEGDAVLIRRMAARLIAGQNAWGGWTYYCPLLSKDQEEELRRLLGSAEAVPPKAKGPAAVAGKPDRPPPPRREEVRPGGIFPGQPSVPGDLADLPAVRYRPGQNLDINLDMVLTPREGRFVEQSMDLLADNSNTQFAMLGVWAAQRHGVPAERCLAMAAQRFRQSQKDDGHWCYLVHPSPLSQGVEDSMTCAGLLGLAVGRGIEKDSDKRSERDPAVEKGLRYLGQRLEREVTLREPGWTGMGYPPNYYGFRSLGDLYFFWSVERVGVIYGLNKIGKTEWYPWGVPLILRRQKNDGSWQEMYGPQVDTCFALLFLKRVNVAQDLTKKINHLQFAPEAGQTLGTLGKEDPQRPRPPQEPRQP